MTRPPVPPFDEETARQKVKAAEDGWNSRNPEKVALAYTPDSKWRNRDEFFEGREEIVAFLKRKWERELDYQRQHGPRAGGRVGAGLVVGGSCSARRSACRYAAFRESMLSETS